MKNWICAGALALALAGCKEQASPADTAKNNPQLGTPSAGGGPPGAVTGGGRATMERQTAAGTPGGPTDDLGGSTNGTPLDAGPLDAGPLDAGIDAGPK